MEPIIFCQVESDFAAKNEISANLLISLISELWKRACGPVYQGYKCFFPYSILASDNLKSH